MTVQIEVGDCLDVLRTLDAGSVNCCVTSPPYFGLRDYGHDGQIGLESTPGAYVAKMVDVFREVRRVLRADGTLWLNLGDSYAQAGGRGEQGATSQRKGRANIEAQKRRSSTTPPDGSKAKDLLGIPWRVAFALQADGWYLRQDIIWHKPNPMPESVRDRCTKAHEYIFLLSKSPKYYFDWQAMQEPATFKGPNGRQLSPYAQGFARRSPEEEQERRVSKSGNKVRKPAAARDCPRDGVAGSIPWEGCTRNKRSVWTVTTKPFKGAHFATFPPDLIEPCVLAGCPEGGTVLDPFGGAGTTGLVASKRDRNALLIELNPEYAEIARARIPTTGDWLDV